MTLTALPVIKPIPFRDPLAAFAPLADRDMAMFLDSCLEGERGRFSYIAADPFRVIRCTPCPWAVTVDGHPSSTDPFTATERELAHFPLERPNDAPVPFLGGAIGFLSYELGGVLEDLAEPKTAPFPWDVALGLYDVIAAFDLKKCQAWVIATGFPESEPTAQRQRAEARARKMSEMLGSEPLPAMRPPTETCWHHETSQEEYEAHVAAAVEATYAGDIYQANFSQRFLAEMPDDTVPFELYRRLRASSPAPFAAFINADNGMKILSASPERFLRINPSGGVEARPIKGTRPRGQTAEEDLALAEELQLSAKDRAENLMIVDLLRNDLSHACRSGSISVPTLCGLETFPAVHHLVSVVTGTLRDGAASIDLLRAAFPGGSITGAPKIKAMEIIHTLETSARGPYCGTIAWLGFDGAMDSSIVIRTIVVNGQTMVVQAGGGIVAESDPAREYQESLVKARPLLAAFQGAGTK